MNFRLAGNGCEGFWEVWLRSGFLGVVHLWRRKGWVRDDGRGIARCRGAIEQNSIQVQMVHTMNLKTHTNRCTIDTEDVRTISLQVCAFLTLVLLTTLAMQSYEKTNIPKYQSFRDIH